MTPDPRCGTYAGYAVHRNAHERLCEPCRRAGNRYKQERLLSLMNGQPYVHSSVGTARRMQAMVALGHSLSSLARRLNVSPDQTWKWAHAETVVTRRTAAKVGRLYDKLCMTPPPTTTRAERHAAAYARTVAKKNGWLPPLVWQDIDDPDERPSRGVDRSGSSHDDVDPVVVARILAGDWRTRATAAERAEVIARWDGSRNELGRLTGWKIERYTTELAS